MNLSQTNSTAWSLSSYSSIWRIMSFSCPKLQEPLNPRASFLFTSSATIPHRMILMGVGWVRISSLEGLCHPQICYITFSVISNCSTNGGSMGNTTLKLVRYVRLVKRRLHLLTRCRTGWRRWKITRTRCGRTWRIRTVGKILPCGTTAGGSFTWPVPNSLHMKVGTNGVCLTIFLRSRGNELLVKHIVDEQLDKTHMLHILKASHLRYSYWVPSDRVRSDWKWLPSFVPRRFL